jgi:hypothetical protein
MFKIIYLGFVNPSLHKKKTITIQKLVLFPSSGKEVIREFSHSVGPLGGNIVCPSFLMYKNAGKISDKHRILSYHQTGKLSKNIYSFHRFLQKQICDVLIFTQHTAVLPAPNNNATHLHPS